MSLATTVPISRRAATASRTSGRGMAGVRGANLDRAGTAEGVAAAGTAGGVIETINRRAAEWRIPINRASLSRRARRR